MTLRNPLIDELLKAEDLAERGTGLPSCVACDVLAHMPPGDQKDAIEAALAGSIGRIKLAGILSKHGIPIGRRSIQTHRDHLEASA